MEPIGNKKAKILTPVLDAAKFDMHMTTETGQFESNVVDKPALRERFEASFGKQ